MKLMISLAVLTFACVSAAFAGEPLRDLKLNPLTKNEQLALRAAAKMAADIDEMIAPECVNASFEYGTEPVSIQFLTVDDIDGASCIDPHYSIEVKIKNSIVISVKLIDA